MRTTAAERLLIWEHALIGLDNLPSGRTSDGLCALAYAGVINVIGWDDRRLDSAVREIDTLVTAHKPFLAHFFGKGYWWRFTARGDAKRRAVLGKLIKADLWIQEVCRHDAVSV